MVFLELFFAWSYQYTLLRILDYTAEEIDLGEAERRGRISVGRQKKMLEEIIALDQERDKEEAARAFRRAKVSGGKVDSVTPLERENQSLAVGLMDSLSVSSQSEGRNGVSVERFNGFEDVNSNLSVSGRKGDGNVTPLKRGNKLLAPELKNALNSCSQREGRNGVSLKRFNGLDTELTDNTKERSREIMNTEKTKEKNYREGKNIGKQTKTTSKEQKNVDIRINRENKATISVERGRKGLERDSERMKERERDTEGGLGTKARREGCRDVSEFHSTSSQHQGLLSNLAKWFREAGSKHKME
ncbi:hypothetical protein E2C01_082998 [Portunus trituberculatus]|uniref:Uncharacterized protein n=1 Tax=Portunus trituberculatus TaxID=210409 RepID=A0A5B7J2A5_PORTR|nr:hypothetical protein [Portunus trituberculatus]